MGSSCRRTALAAVGALAVAGASAVPAAAAPKLKLPQYRVTSVTAPDPQTMPGRGTAAAPDPFGTGFGERLRTIGDVNHDGAKDVLVSTVHYVRDGVVDSGRLSILSGRTRRQLRVIDNPAPQAGALFGFWTAAVGDVNGDRTPDFVASADGQDVGANADQGEVFVFSGSNGRLLRTIDDPEPQVKGDFGGNLIAPGDIDGDGTKDILVTASRHFGGVGAAYAFSGRTGRLLYRVLNPDPTQASGFGFGAAETGDVDGDGVGDYQIGAPFYNQDGKQRVGRSYLFSGKKGTLLHTLPSPYPEAGARFGQADSDGAVTGNVIGSKARDIYVDGFLASESADLAQSGRGFLFDGANGRYRHAVDDPMPSAGGQFGTSVAPGGDLDKDGRPDIIVGATPHHIPTSSNVASHAAVFGGAKLSRVVKVFDDPANEANADFGNSIASPGDVNGDGFPDYFIGARSANVGTAINAGKVYAFISRDRTRPRKPDVTAPSTTRSHRPLVRVATSDADNPVRELSVYCRVDRGRLRPCGKRHASRPSFRPHLSKGRHTLTVQVRDVAGNRSATRVRHIRVR